MINTTTGYCTFPICSRIVERNGFCFLHAPHFAGPKPEKARTSIQKESKKRKKEKKTLAVIKAGKMIELNGLCQLNGPNCQKWATDYEHIQKSSPKNYIDPNNGTLACRNCNRDKELHPELFKEHSVSRFKK